MYPPWEGKCVSHLLTSSLDTGRSKYKEKDKVKTFTTKFRLWEFNVIPFGLCIAPPDEKVLINLQFRFLCLDDVVVFSGTFQGHLVRLQVVFQ